MDFTGKYELQSEDNLQPIMKAIGIPDEMYNKFQASKTVQEIEQNGKSFTMTATIDSNIIVTKFTLGEEAEIDFLTGEKIKTTFNLEGDTRLVANLKGVISVIELSGDTLINTMTLGDISGKRIMKRV